MAAGRSRAGASSSRGWAPPARRSVSPAGSPTRSPSGRRGPAGRRQFGGFGPTAQVTPLDEFYVIGSDLSPTVVDGAAGGWS